MTKVFITGATGYIGGTVLEQLTTKYPSTEISVLARSAEKGAQVTAKFPKVAIVIGDLDSTEILEEQSALADVVINTADCDHTGSAHAIIRGIEKRGGGYLIHTSGAGLLFDEPNGSVLSEKVWDDIADLEELSSFPETAIHRPAEKIVLEAPPSVHTAIISPGKVYGIGTGPVKTYTVPLFSNTIISAGTGFIIGTGVSKMASIHVGDLARLYILLFEEALKPNGGAAYWDAEGYYFGQTDEIAIGDHIKILTEELAELGHIKSKEVEQYTVEKVAKIHPWFPYAYASNARCTSSRARKLGWKPVEKGVYESLPNDVRKEFSGGKVATLSWNPPAVTGSASGMGLRN